MDDFNRMKNEVTSQMKKYQGKIPNFDPKRGSSKMIPLAIALAGVGFVLFTGLYKVEGGHRAIIFNRFVGVKPDIYSEGLRFAIPVLERPIIYNVRARANSISSLTGSRDLQMINLTVRVLHKPDDAKLPQIYRELGQNYAERVLPSIGNEVLKSVIAQFTAAELLTKRKIVSDSIARRLVNRAAKFGIIVEDVSITHLQFGKEYSAAVEAKQVAQQDAERAKIIVQRAEQEKKSMIIKAQGESEAIRLVSEAIEKNKEFIELRKIQAATDIAKTISKSNNKVYLSSDTLLLNLMNLTEEDSRLESSTSRAGKQ